MGDIVLDDIDNKILNELRKDGRRSNIEIARSVGCTEGTVRRRLKRLLDSGVGKVVFAVNPPKLGYPVEVLISLSVDLDKVEAVANELALKEEVNYVGLITGDFDILVNAQLRDSDDVFNFIHHTLARIPGVKHTQTLYILKVIKRTYHWIP
jgi:Lrp/AsnC family transcriptional regulator for asnA, asnC and gidA